MGRYELKIAVTFGTPPSFMPHEVGERFTQTMDNQKIECEIVHVEVDEANRLYLVTARSVDDG